MVIELKRDPVAFYRKPHLVPVVRSQRKRTGRGRCLIFSLGESSRAGAGELGIAHVMQADSLFG